jgi:hypothetical protein
MHRWVATATACLLMAAMAACGTSQTATAKLKYYPVPTSSWRPGDFSLTALTIGTLAAGMYRGRWCMWLVGPDSRRHPIVWPAGFRARRHPLELVDSRGTILARGGEHIKVGGGVVPDSHQPCMLGRKNAFYAMGYPTRVES